MPRHNYVQLTWTDLSNITRCHVVNETLYEKQVKKEGISMAGCLYALPYVRDALVEVPSVKLTFMPDSSTLKPIHSWAPGGQLVFGPILTDDGQPSPCCPRSFLAKQAELLRLADIDVSVGFELEFFLLNEKDLTPINNGLYAETKSLGTGWDIMTEIADTLTDLDIPVWRFHTEGAPSQFEVSIGPFFGTKRGSLVKAADALVLARETIYHIAAKHGKKATFAPKPFNTCNGVGAHAHFSLQRGSKNLFEVSPPTANAFLAGVLSNLPNLMMVLAPTGNSYERFRPLTFSGAYQCMGAENKEAALRLIKEDSGTLSRFEVKSIDGTSNAYLMVGSVLAAGLHGIRRGAVLPEEVTEVPAEMPVERRPALLPQSLAEAIDLFEKSGVSEDFFGKDMCSMLLKLRRFELEDWESGEGTKESKVQLIMRRF